MVTTPAPILRRRERGVGYLALLLALAAIGTGIGIAGVVWSTDLRREKEEELMRIGDEFRRAIALYYYRTPGSVKRYPKTLEALLADTRYSTMQRYLRRIYRDPLTGNARWGIVDAPDGGIAGVYSLSAATPLKRTNVGKYPFADARSYSEWRFLFTPYDR